MRKQWLSVLSIVALILVSAAPVMAQDGTASPGSGQSIFVPFVSSSQGAADAAARQGNGEEAAKPYIVVMEQQPAVAYAGGVNGFAPTKPGKGGKINPNSAAVKKYDDLLKQSHKAAVQSVGANPSQVLHNYTYALNGFAALLTPAQAKAMAAQPGVARVLPDEMRFKTTDTSPTFLGLTGPGGVWASGITGENVVVGVIDTGIWPEHPSFADDGSYGPSPVGPVACDFGNTAHNPNDAPFTCNDKLLGATEVLTTYKAVIGLTPGEYDSARDDDGHGTHTASTAAGNANVAATIFGIPRGTISGIAPRARVIAYKGLGEQGGFTSDLAAAIDQAVADGVDVINYSIGGGASLTGGDELAFLFAADAGVFVANSAGNSGPGAATIGGPASAPWLTAVGASTHNRTFISNITITGPGVPPTGLWGATVTPGIQNFRLVDAEGVPDAAGDKSGRCLNPFNGKKFQSNEAVLCNQYDFGVARTDRVANLAAAGAGAVVFFNSPGVSMTPTDNHPLPTIHLLNGVGQQLKNYLVQYKSRVRISFGTGVASFAGQDPRVKANVMASFSSRGPDPVALDIIKPDVTAPGISILAGASPIHVGTAAQGQLFQAIMGTSMSGPHVAGIFALMKQAHPDWTPAMAKSALMTSAYQEVVKQDYVSLADPFDMGAGHVNPGGLGNKGSPFDPGLVYDAGFLEYLGFLCDAAPEVFGNPAATCASLASNGIPTKAINLNLASIGVSNVPGSETVVRTVTSVASGGPRTYQVSVNPPPGFQVTVSPSSLTLSPGMTATYQVNITNVNAPIGQWRFGSLTWQDGAGNYAVRSPIAARASLFSAPAEIKGSGESGSASFDVRFGYTGAYQAAAHGLIAATVTHANVKQDPDQSFDPNDGFSNLHTFALSNAAWFRIKMPPSATEADADLDIYVFDPSGKLVASSTKSGTDEQIDIAQPANGTWRVYVHGWSTPGGDSDYDMYSWIIPMATGGSLSVVSAPGSATSGTTATIQIGWSGATAGQWYLGSVTHTGNNGLMGQTLVNVDNR